MISAASSAVHHPRSAYSVLTLVPVTSLTAPGGFLRLVACSHLSRLMRSALCATHSAADTRRVVTITQTWAHWQKRVNTVMKLAGQPRSRLARA